MICRDSIVLEEVPLMTSIQALYATLRNVIPTVKSTPLILQPGEHFLFWNHLSSENTIQKDGYHGCQAPLDHLWKHRLWKSGSIEFVGDITVGMAATCTETIEDVYEDDTGVVVCIKRDIQQDSVTRLVEYRSLLYTNKDLSEPRAGSNVVDRATAQFTASQTLLFRYAALTWNAHKIHIDQEYARDVEDLPDLIVQGSLSVTIMLKALTNAGYEIKKCSYRMLAPLYVDEPAGIYLTKTNAKSLVLRLIGQRHNDLKVIMKVTL